MNNRISAIRNDVQNRNCEAWLKLCEYIDLVAQEERNEFSPYEALGKELYNQIFTLPESISKLKNVKKMWLYGSNLKRIPPEIGEMEALEYFDPYTSYDLHWFPYEITNCKNLKDSRVSTRVLYGNFKNRKGFPSLIKNPVRYSGQTVRCSVCKKEISYEEVNQLWITLNVATDSLPLLTNLCSKECENRLPTPSKHYIQYPHKGGSSLSQPDMDEFAYTDMAFIKIRPENLEQETAKESNEEWQPLKFIRKIWGK